jgi:zinc resistance-associated protein
MKTRLSAALALLALAGSGLAIAAANDPQSPAPSKIEKSFEFTPADRAAFFDARIAALRAGLKLTPEQEKLWPPVEAAVRASFKGAMERHDKMRHESENIIDRLRERGESAVAHGQSMQAVAAAAAPLYATLTEEQKHRLPVLMHGIGHGSHHFAMSGGGRGGEHMGDDHMGDRMGGPMGEHMGMRGEGMEGHDGMHGRDRMMQGGGQHHGDGPDGQDDDE